MVKRSFPAKEASSEILHTLYITIGSIRPEGRTMIQLTKNQKNKLL